MENKEVLKAEIKRLAKEKDAVILAHYYVDGDVQDIADFVGDSYALAKIAKNDPRKTIVFCGVTFMGESACILNPDKTVLVPNTNADFVEILQSYKIQISMDGIGRCKDNIFVERTWRTLKYEWIFLRDYRNEDELRKSCGEFVDFFNKERIH